MFCKIILLILKDMKDTYIPNSSTKGIWSFLDHMHLLWRNYQGLISTYFNVANHLI